MRTDQTRRARNAERVGKLQYLLDTVNAPGIGNAAVSKARLSRPLNVDSTGAERAAAGNEREKSGAVAALGRNGEVVLAPKPRRQRKALARSRARRHRDNAVEIGISLQNAGRVGKHQGVDGGLRPSLAQAVDQRRRHQHIAQTPQRDDQNARLLGERDTVGGNHGAAPLDPFAALALSAMPPATPTPTT